MVVGTRKKMIPLAGARRSFCIELEHYPEEPNATAKVHKALQK